MKKILVSRFEAQHIWQVIFVCYEYVSSSRFKELSSIILLLFRLIHFKSQMRKLYITEIQKSIDKRSAESTQQHYRNTLICNARYSESGAERDKVKI